MKVSILVPVYKVEQYIERCARSIFEQTYHDLEIIFIDDCSPDNSISIINNVLQQYPQRIQQTQIIKHQKNKGLSAGRNTGIANATGDYVFHVDSDDYITTDAIEKLVSNAIKTNADIVFSQHSIETSVSIIPQTIYYPPIKNKLLKNILLKKCPTTIWNKLIKRELYIDNNIVIPETINNGEDYITLPRLIFYSSKISLINEHTYIYNQTNPSSFKASVITKKHFKDHYPANTYLAQFFKEHNSKYYKYLESMQYAIFAGHLLWAQNISEIKDEIQNKPKQKASINAFLHIPFQYTFINLLAYLKLYTLLLKIGRKFRANYIKK